MAEMYNEDFKNEFLSNYPEKTRDAYRYIFFRSFNTENILGRDLYTFNTDEIELVLRSANHTTINSIRLSYNVIVSYLTWATKYRPGSINPAGAIGMEELRSYIDMSKKLYITEEELIDMENKLVNYQDKAIIRLIFEGVNGFQHSEILNLTPEDIDESTNELKVKDDKHGERTVKVSDRCIDILIKAAQETEYQMKNGEAQGKRSSVALAENGHVIKTKITRNENLGRADRHLIYRTITSISVFFGLTYLTPKRIEQSGMIRKGKDIFDEKGELENEDLNNICEQFNVSVIKMNGYKTYNYSMIREFVNEDNIKNLYN